MPDELPMILIMLIIGFFLGILWTCRFRIISLINWQYYLSNLRSPKAIITHSTGRVLFANHHFLQLFNMTIENGVYDFCHEHEKHGVLSILRYHPWPRPFIDVRTDFHSTASMTIPRHARLSGLPIWCSWKKAWIVTLDLENETSSFQPFASQDTQIFRCVINSLTELVCFHDVKGRVVGSNLAFDRFWKGREEEGFRINTSENMKERQTQQVWTTNLNGESCLLEVNHSVLRNGNKCVIGSLSISHDVTNWHLMRQSLEQEIEARQLIEQELKKRSNVLSSIFNASVDPIGIYNDKYKFLGGNSAFAEALGITQDKFEDEFAVDVMNKEILQQNQRIDKPVLESGITIKYEELVMKRDGSFVWYETTKTQFRDPIDDTIGVLMIARDVTERKATQQQLADAIMELEELSFIDGLTKVANRRSFDEELVKLWHVHSREKTQLSLIFCDIDYFKYYNDNYGHQKGDVALQRVAEVFQRMIHRPLDFVARYGGEEFAILLPNTSCYGALVVAKNIAEALENISIVHEHSPVSEKLTLSQGIACLVPDKDQDYGELLSLADEALYKAKRAGRNQIVVN